MNESKKPSRLPGKPLAPTETLAALKDLFANGLIDMNKLKTSAFLTPEGYAAVEREREGEEENP
ncbi:MAG: hypothetical protein JW883_01025 [Deltaproteobacteria bacterium]|nr:hypothetical protein [Deltaproteobacteria bacterium]